MANPPDAVRARAGRQVNHGVKRDGVFLYLPAAATLIGEGCLDTIIVETYAVRAGDGDRTSRERHDAILALGVMGGLLFDPTSVYQNQKVGRSFTDEKRAKGGERPRLSRVFGL